MKDTKEKQPEHSRKRSASNVKPPFQYMGLQIDPGVLYAQGYILDLLQRKGGFDRTLDEVRGDYRERFGLDLIWKYPLSDDMAGGGTLIPVQEGLLYLPYKESGETVYRINTAAGEAMSRKGYALLLHHASGPG